MPKLTIDGKEVEVPQGFTVFQACREAGVEIPHFCYHDRLNIAGNCRMCLVEMEKAPKPIASCAMPAADGMVIKTGTPTVQKARQGVMEFLLLNHPLDCPICDQGGECDLQDQAMAYGYDRGRTLEMRRAVKDKYMGPLVGTVMTRCIHCTRCIRFITDVAGVPELGATGRGEGMEVTTYVEKALTSELSGNIIDLCPVGALTSKPYAFTARPWELKKTESVDVLDAVGAAIRIDARAAEVMRILPRLNEEINEEWLGDKSRFAYDGLRHQRLDRPYIRVNGALKEASWEEAFGAIVQRVKGMDGKKIAAVAGDMCDAESMFALKELMGKLGSKNIECRNDGAMVDPQNRAGYLFNSTIAGIEQADAFLIIGSNLRAEAPLVMSRLRKRYLQGGFKIGVVGPEWDITAQAEFLGNNANILTDIASGKHPFSETLKNAKNPMLILGTGAMRRADGAAVLKAARDIAEKCNMVRDDWNGFNMLHLAAARVGGLDMGFAGPGIEAIYSACQNNFIDVVYLLGADEIDMTKLGKAFVIYQGHHGDAGAHRADVILPGAAYTEKDGIYVNTEGRVQHGYQAILPPGQAKEDWKVIRALSERLALTLPFNTLSELRDQLVKAYPTFGLVDVAPKAAWGKFGGDAPMASGGFAYPIQNYYMTDPISRASVTMARCTEEFIQGRKAAA